MRGLRQLRYRKIGHPSTVKSIEVWHDILSTIIYTFETTQKIADIEVLLPDQTMQGVHTLTKSEYDRYEQGWKYFKKYFFSLWD